MGKIRQIKIGMIITASVVLIAILVGYHGQNTVAKKGAATTQTATKTTKTVHLSFMGDDTLGTDPQLKAATNLPTVWAQHGNDPHYFFKNVSQYFKHDDLTVANLETTFASDSRQEAAKPGNIVFHFKGNPKLVAALKVGGIYTVTVSNNHIFDYGKGGFQDTIEILKKAQLGYFGEGYRYVKTVKGVKLGFLGYQGWAATRADKQKITKDIRSLRKQGCAVVIPYFHWGIERNAYPNDTQKTLAHYAINHGADMVIGSHPHVIESMESYKGKLIAYSMSNFAFGGNPNPADKRSFILQTNMMVKGKKMSAMKFRVIPTRISTTDSHNDYVPTPYTGSQKVAVLQYMNQLSLTLDNRISAHFTTLPK